MKNNEKYFKKNTSKILTKINDRNFWKKSDQNCKSCQNFNQDHELNFENNEQNCKDWEKF